MPIVLEPVAAPPLGVDTSTALGLVNELGMRMGDFAYGSVTDISADTTYIQDRTRPEPDNLFTQGWLSYRAVVSGPSNDGLERRITGYDGTINTGRFLLGNGQPGSGLVLPAQPGDLYYVHLRWSKRRKLAALNRAIHRLPQGFWTRIEDTSITTADRIWTYPVPTSIQNLWEVHIQTSLNMSGPGDLAQGRDGRGFPFQRMSGWSVRTDVDPGGLVARTLQLGDLAPWPRVLRLVGSGVQRPLVADTDLVSVGQDDYDQRLQEYLLSYAAAYLWMESADGAPVDTASRSQEMIKLSMQLAAELRNDLVMPPPPLEIDSPATVGRMGWGDNPQWFAALHTPGPPR